MCIFNLEKIVKCVYFENNCVYGAKRIFEILKLQGVRTSYKTIYHICHNNGYVALSAIKPAVNIPKLDKIYKPVGINDANAFKITPSTINEAWVCDWTRFALSDGSRIYVYVIMDLFSRRIIGFKTTESGEVTKVQVELLKEVIIKRNPSDKLYIHSDNGDSFRHEFYKNILKNLRFIQTFNRIEFGCADNAHMESFFATLNKEFYRPSFLDLKGKIAKYKPPHLTLENFNKCLTKYINFYNNKRVHSSIGYITPRQYESTIKTYIPIKYRRDIMHVDINACYAQYEVMMNPSLKGKKLVVIGEEYKRDKIIVCASYEARKYNIGCGDSLKYARAVCPDIVVRKSNKKLYEKISKRFFEILYRYTDMVEPYGIDEAWIDVTHSHKLFGDNMSIARSIMSDLKNEMRLTVSIGISYNKIWSKLASDLHKPDAITYIPYKYYRKITHNLPVEMLLFVGDKTKEMFNFYGIKTIGDLAFADKKIVTDVVGGKNATKLIDYANGYEFSAVRFFGDKQVVKSLSRGETVEKNIKTFNELMDLISRLCMEVAYKVRKEKMVASAICVKLRDQKYNDHSMQMKILNTDSGILMFENIERLLMYKLYGKIVNNNVANLPTLADYNERLPYEIREVSVIAFKLTNQYENVINIRSERIRKIDKCIDKINDKYNSNVVYLARQAEPWYYHYMK